MIRLWMQFADQLATSWWRSARSNIACSALSVDKKLYILS
jgi:hypothetical protein